MQHTRRIVSPLIVLLALLIPFTANAGDLNADLLKAAEEGKTEVVKTLITKGADVNARPIEGKVNGWTALMAAAENGHTETVRALLEAGADLNARDKNGKTALTYAKENSHTEIVQLLKQAGANVVSSPRKPKQKSKSKVKFDLPFFRSDPKLPTGAGDEGG